MRTALKALLMTLATQVGADPFTVNGDAVVYDTVNSEVSEEIDFGHDEQLLEILKTNENIRVLILNSEGGYLEAGYDIADIVIDAELDTHVDNVCESACATIFLAGKKRSLGLGGKIGFHSSSWAAESTQAEIFSDFEYLLEREVEAKFAIKTLKASSDSMWYPRRKELEAAGVLRKGS
jgi:hypothetical protein